MPQEIAIIDPIHHPGWDELVLSTGSPSFFHSSSWATVLHEAYGYKPVYFALIDAGRLRAMIPCMEIRSFLTGKRAVSLPFSDDCEPIIAGEASRETSVPLLDALISFGKKAGWKSVELRSGVPLSPPCLPFRTYYGHTVDVAKVEEELFSALRDSTRRNIRKAMKDGVNVELVSSLDAVRAFYRLHCLTRRHHGLPPQPFHFFEKLYEHALSDGKGIVALASFSDTYIAGAIFLHFGKNAIYKYGASDRTYQHRRANNLVMWEAMKWYSRNGYRRISLGRTEPENDGLLQFKRGWSAEERMVPYYKYDLKRDRFVREGPRSAGGHHPFLHRMPIPLLRLAGSVLYRHIG